AAIACVHHQTPSGTDAPEADLVVVRHADKGPVRVRPGLKKPYPRIAGTALADAHAIGYIEAEARILRPYANLTVSRVHHQAPLAAVIAPEADLVVIGHADEGSVQVGRGLEKPDTGVAGIALANAHAVADIKAESGAWGSYADV